MQQLGTTIKIDGMERMVEGKIHLHQQLTSVHLREYNLQEIHSLRPIAYYLNHQTYSILALSRDLIGTLGIPTL